MNAYLILSIILLYFLVIILLANFTSKKSNSNDFYNASKSSPWYLVAFGMIGTTLSGVTFISVPGWVGDSQFSYFEMVLGYIVGYAVVALVLMPLYYRMNLITIYSYLKERFGNYSYKTGSAFFILSRLIGASFRLYLVAIVLQFAIFDALNIPFFMTVLITIILIWVYTFQGGIKTIVYTDTLQTSFMLLALIFCIFQIKNQLDWSMSEAIAQVHESQFSQIFFWGDSPKNFFKQFFAGIFIVIVMTGLDQDMMQKNLTCRNIKEAQKNMLWFTGVLVFVKYLFLFFGALLFLFVAKEGIPMPEKADMLFPTIALGYLSPIAGLLFILGLVAAAYSSADSAITSLTTTYCIDFLNFEPGKTIHEKRTRMLVHLVFSILIFFIVVAFYQIQNESVISSIFTVAGYTYGPLLGLFAFGLLLKQKVHDKFVPIICLVSPFLTYIINIYSEKWVGYKFGFELLILNGLITFIGLLIFTKSNR